MKDYPLLIIVTKIEVDPGDTPALVTMYSKLRGNVLRAKPVANLFYRAVCPAGKEYTLRRNREAEDISGYISGSYPTQEEKDIVAMLYPTLTVDWSMLQMGS